MSESAEEPHTSRLLVAVGMGTYEHLERLPRAVSDVEAVADRFQGAGFTPTTILDMPREPTVRAIHEALPEEQLRGSSAVLVLLWAGHAAENSNTRSLRLFTTANRASDPDGLAVTAEDVAEIAARSGASQILMILDACYSGGSVIDVARVVDSVQHKLIDGEPRWLGVFASSQAYERAVDGALASKLLDLLEHGPSTREMQIRWNSFQAGVRGDDLIDALAKEWQEERQAPKRFSSGDPWPILPNPRYREGAPEQVVEHLLWAARGGAQNEAGVSGFWFTGRVAPLRRIVEWMTVGEPGLCILTGSAGCGKSAVAGRIVSLSNSEERANIAAAQGLPPADLDPGEGSVAGHLQARGLTLEHCSEMLARVLDVPAAGQIPNHHDVLAWASRLEQPPVLVFDGLDEAGTEGFRIATDLLAPLASYALVLVASRETAARDDGESLLSSLGSSAVRIDLDADRGATDRDVHDYVIARLTGFLGTPVEQAMDAELVAEEVVRLARSEEDASGGPFLLARILTSQLIANPIHTSAEDWRSRMSVSVEEAFATDLAQGRPLVRDGEELPHAAREMLGALAYSYGSGFPADDVWPAVASVLSPTGTQYGRLDVYWVLGEYSRYVTASGLGGSAVYRLHQRLADTLREDDRREGIANATSLVAGSLLELYGGLLERGERAISHPYLWLYAWRHAVDGELPAIESLKLLADLDPALTPDVAMSLNSLGVSYSEVGRRADAVAPTERAVELYERLANENPAFLNDLAGSLNSLGNRYSEVGRRADAVAPTERAVEIYERLAKENPASLNDLAGSLNNLGVFYSQVGRRADAVAPTERAVEIRERLANENPAFLNELAGSLNNLGNRYSEVGRRADAVAPTERAVEIREQLAEENPAFLGQLAASLNNLGSCYSDVGRRADALALTERAVEIRERLAEENPAFLSDLAGSLNNLGVFYSQVGRRADAVAPTERAVEFHERLAEENPAFLGELAGSLNNLGNRYNEVGRRVDAVAPTERAVEIREQLAEENPAFLGDLANSLNNLGVFYGDVGRRADAVAPTERAVEIHELLAKGNPAFVNDLAGSLNNLGIRYSEVGRRADAVAPTERAVEIREQLAEENPAFLGDLAASLNNLGIRYSEVGRQADAVAPTERAVEIHEQLAKENPGFLGELAGSLSNVGNRYSEVGRLEDAVAPAERAAEIRERLARENPAFLVDLAGSLNNLGVLFSGVGRGADAVAPMERAVEIREQLVEENPVFLGDLAGSLNNLGIFYSQVGRQADAVAPTERAVEIRERLAEENQAFLGDLANSLNNLVLRYGEMEDHATGQSRWDQVIARFAPSAVAGVILRLRRLRSSEEFEEGVRDLVSAHKLDSREDTRLTADVHHGCRSFRSRDPERFDRLWQNEAGECPTWLTVSDEAIETCVEWLRTPTWVASRDYLTSHAELLSETGVAALTEVALDYPEEPLIAQHHALLREIGQAGIDSSYKPLLAADVARAWRAIGDLEDSERFLLEHLEELSSDYAIAALSERDPLGVAVLTMARAGEADLAYRVMKGAETQVEVLVAARHAPEPERLWAVSTICLAAAADDAQRAKAALHIAIALAIAGSREVSVDMVHQLHLGESPVDELLDDLADAIAHHPQHAATLTTLLRSLSAPDR